MRVLERCILLALVALAPGVHAQTKKDGTHPMPLMRSLKTVSPWQTFQHLRRGNVVCQKTAPDKPVAARPRPFGPGRRIAAIAAPIGLNRPVAELFAVANRDLLILASPGPLVRREEVEALEHAAVEQQVSLLIILVDPGDPFFTSKAPHLRQRRRGAERFSAQERIDVPSAHGILQAEAIWQSSDLLARRHRQGRFQVAVGLLRDKTGAIEWVTKWHKRWQLITSSSVKEALKLRQAQVKQEKADRQGASDDDHKARDGVHEQGRTEKSHGTNKKGKPHAERTEHGETHRSP